MQTIVQTVMTTDVVTVSEQTPFKEIVELLRQHRVNAVPVLDDKGRVRGIVSTSDLIVKEADPTAAESENLIVTPRRFRERQKSAGTTAAELMTSPARTTTPGDTVQTAAQQMRRHRISRLPVVDPDTGTLAGIVTRSDILRVYDRPDADIERDVRAELADRRLGPAAEKIQVTVNHGRVEVRGEVNLRSQIPALMHTIRRVEGVVSAQSALTWDTDDFITMRYPIT